MNDFLDQFINLKKEVVHYTKCAFEIQKFTLFLGLTLP